MKAKSFQADSVEATQRELQKAMSDDFRPTVAFVFVAVSWDRTALRAVFEEHGISIFGCTTFGEFIDGAYGQDTVAVLLLDMNPQAFRFAHQTFTPGSELKTAADLAAQAKEWFSNPVFMVATSHMETMAEDVIEGIESVMGSQAQIFGAMAGMDPGTLNNAVFTNGTDLKRGVLFMVIDGDRIDVNGVATCGWKPVGPIKTVTKSKGMWVQEIDGEPALDLMLKYSGACTREELNQEFWINEFAMSLPPQLIKEEGAAVMRPSLVYDKASNSVMCNGRVPQGSKIRFSLPPDDDVVDAVIKACEKLKSEKAPEADAIVYFSCAGRRLSMGPLLKREIETVRALWDAPLAGFFSLGEIARVTGGGNELNNISSSCVVLKEK
ncbi:FIST C-terminal domain-containing protein [bacterium]|nr:FIST C-terminal domain-containing protein [bacterium]